MPNHPKLKKRLSFDELAKHRIPMDLLNKVLFLGIMGIVLSGAILYFYGATEYFWLLFVIGLILSTNAIWLRYSFSLPFIFPFIITMLRTKHFVSLIESIAHHAKWFEKICLVGMFLGFGLAGIDYWYGKNLSKGKRFLLLVFSALALASFYYFFLGFVFLVPALAPLYVPALIGFVLLGFGGFSLAILIGYGVLAVIGLFSAKQLCPAVAPVIPGVPIPGLGVPIPLIAWVSLAMVLIIHEFSHGIMMVYYREKIKSVGLLLAGIIPMGAFVEQDDKTFDELEDKKALMVLSAGSASNIFSIIVALFLIFLIGFVTAPFNSVMQTEFAKTYSGIRIISIQDTISFCGIDANAPAKGKLFAGDIVKYIDGAPITDINSLNTEFVAAKGDIDFVVQRRDDSNVLVDVNVSVTPVKFEDLGIKRIGAEFGVIDTGYKVGSNLTLLAGIWSLFSQILLFYILLSFAAGSFNYFPSDPFDGGKMAKIILSPYVCFMNFDSKKEKHKFIGRLFIWLLLISFALNLIPYITMFVY
jgi:hypothetical protein